MLQIEYLGQFKKDFKLAVKRGCDIAQLQKVITLLAEQQPLPQQYRDHALTDSKEYKGVRECHIKPDWLLIYKVLQEKLILLFIRTGSHSDLF